MKGDISYPLALLAGVLSFLSPCVLPIFPSYLSFITGLTFEDLTTHSDKRKMFTVTLTNSIVFVLGFSTIFVALGASSSFVGEFFLEYQKWIRIAGGILTIAFGLFIAGFMKLDFLLREKKFYVKSKHAGLVGTYLIGMSFAAGWTPCIGPILGAILLYSAGHGSAAYGLKLLSVYSAGLAIPFIVSALALNTFLSFTRILYKHMALIKVLSGIVLIIFGILLLTDNFKVLSSFMPKLGIEL